MVGKKQILKGSVKNGNRNDRIRNGNDRIRNGNDLEMTDLHQLRACVVTLGASAIFDFVHERIKGECVKEKLFKF